MLGLNFAADIGLPVCMWT